jgi:hypothetical protein
MDLPRSTKIVPVGSAHGITPILAWALEEEDDYPEPDDCVECPAA